MDKQTKIFLAVAALGAAVWYFFIRKGKGETIAGGFKLTPRPTAANGIKSPHPSAANPKQQAQTWQSIVAGAVNGQPVSLNGVTVDISKPLARAGAWIGSLFGSKPAPSGGNSLDPATSPDPVTPSSDEEQAEYEDAALGLALSLPDPDAAPGLPSGASRLKSHNAARRSLFKKVHGA